MTSRRERSIRTWRRVTRSLILAVAMVVLSPAQGFAQLNAQNIKGDAGTNHKYPGARRPAWS